ncbi:hypothetical protein ABZT34_29535 [Streptomyces sp. NPDC005329]
MGDRWFGTVLAPASTPASTTDGERLGELPLTARCVPGAVRLIGP